MGDLISRQAAIDALMAWEEESIWDDECLEHRGEPFLTAPSDVVEQLPSVQPEITVEQVKEYCKENGYVVLLSDEYNWLKSLKSKSEEFRWNGGGNY